MDLDPYSRMARQGYHNLQVTQSNVRHGRADESPAVFHLLLGAAAVAARCYGRNGLYLLLDRDFNFWSAEQAEKKDSGQCLVIELASASLACLKAFNRNYR